MRVVDRLPECWTPSVISEHLRSSVPSRSLVGSSSCRGRRARWSGRGSALCCSCCGQDIVGGIGNTCGECLLLAHGSDPWNSCVGHGEGQGAEHVHEVAEETKPKSASSGSWVWQPLEGSIPVGDELVKDPRRVSEKSAC